MNLPDDSIHDEQVPQQPHCTDQAVGGSDAGGQDEAGGVASVGLLGAVGGSQQLLGLRAAVDVPLPAWQLGGILHVDGEAIWMEFHTQEDFRAERERERVREEERSFRLSLSLTLSRTLSHSLTQRVC